MTKKSAKTIDIITSISQRLLEELKIKGKIVVSQEPNETVNVNIETEDNGLLIGWHGETLNSFQHILSLMVYNELKKWLRIIVDVGDYRQKREQTIKSLALRAASEVALTKQATALSYLVPFERRIVHMTLADHPSVVTESEGNGKQRRVVIKPK